MYVWLNTAFIKRLLFIFLINLICVISYPGSLSAEVLQGEVKITDSTTLHNLYGEWRYFPGDNLEFSAEDFDDSSWQYTIMPSHWNTLQSKSISEIGDYYSGSVWYRITISLSESFKPRDMAILVPFTSLAREIYLDGRLIGSEGVIGKDGKVLEFGPRSDLYRIEAEQLKPGAQHSLAIRISGSYGFGGMINDKLLMGAYDEVSEIFVRHMLYYGMLAAVFLFVGVFYLLLFLLGSRSPVHLYFALLALIFGAYTIASRSITLWMVNSFILHRTLLVLPVMAYPALVILFIKSFFNYKLSRISRSVVILSASASLVYLLTIFSMEYYAIYSRTIVKWFVIIFFPVAIYTQYLSIRAVLDKKIGARIIATGFVLSNVGLLVHICSYLYPVVFFAVVDVAFLCLVISMAVAISYRLAIINKELATTTDYLEKSRDELVAANRIKDEFLANTSHELNTPLHGIIGISRSLLDGAFGSLTSEAKRQTALLLSAGERLTRLVQNITSFSKVKHSRLSLDLKPVNVCEAVKESSELIAPLLENKPVKIENLIADEFGFVQADKNSLQQILINLLGNAVKFTSEGSITFEARRLDGEHKKTPSDSMIEISITDTGTGISKEDSETVFEPFRQLDGSTSRQFGGVGLGLAVTKNLIELHNGTIEIDHSYNSGARFLITLPQAFAPTESEVSDSAPESDNATMNDSIESGTEQVRRRVLIVDDEPIALQVVETFLRVGGYESVKAENGMEALELIKREKVDIALLDVMMPEMSGYELCQRLREKFNAVELPIMMQTAKDRNEDYATGISAGANDYLVKPFKKEQLIKRVERLLNCNQSYRQQLDRLRSELKDRLNGENSESEKVLDKLIEALRERYKQSDRQPAFELQPALRRRLNLGSVDDRLCNLYGVLSELAANDLRFGTVAARYALAVEEEQIVITFNGGSCFRVIQDEQGCNDSRLQNFVTQLNGHIQMKMSDDNLELAVALPLSVFDN